jgi:hypothetical protein
VRKLYIRLVLFFNGVVTCEHPARGLAFCSVCDDLAYRKRIRPQEQRYERLRRLRTELDGRS